MKSNILQHNFQCALIVSIVLEEIYLQPQEILQDTDIFEFTLIIKQDFSYETYHLGIKCTIAFLVIKKSTNSYHTMATRKEGVRFFE